MAGTLHRPDGAPKQAILITSGTGFPATAYAKFAQAAAARGHIALAYDCRGVATSAPASLKGYRADYTHWGALDMPAAVDALAAAAPRVPIVHVGHSVGGFLVGLMPNHAKITRHAFVCSGSGVWWLHPWWYNPLEFMWWWLYGPAVLAIHGHLPKPNLLGGEALPKDLWLVSRRQCHARAVTPALMATGRQGTVAEDYAGVTAPIRHFGASDDPIATRRSVPPILALYPNAQTSQVWWTPREEGLKRIGHDGVFRSRNAKLWAPIWAWLEGE